jgi:hypothetical protein
MTARGAAASSSGVCACIRFFKLCVQCYVIHRCIYIYAVIYTLNYVHVRNCQGPRIGTLIT